MREYATMKWFAVLSLTVLLATIAGCDRGGVVFKVGSDASASVPAEAR